MLLPTMGGRLGFSRALLFLAKSIHAMGNDAGWLTTLPTLKQNSYVRSQGLSIIFRHTPNGRGPLAMGANEVPYLKSISKMVSSRAVSLQGGVIMTAVPVMGFYLKMEKG